jgi:predicted adenylyl cyclase CyaB
MSDKLMTVKETADFLKVHWQTVRNYINSGKIKAVKVGKNVRIRESELQSFIDDKPDEQKMEVEIRFATKKRKTIEEKLLKMNAKIIYHGHIIDHWYAPNYIKNIREKDKFYEGGKGFGIRIREQDNGYTGKIITTLEVKKLAYPPNHEVCIEEEIEVESFERTHNFLSLIEEKEMTILDKERLIYKYKDYKIVIDDIKNFKTGVEIEKVTDKPHKEIIIEMKKLATALGLDLKKEITDKSVTYQYMMKFAHF